MRIASTAHTRVKRVRNWLFMAGILILIAIVLIAIGMLMLVVPFVIPTNPQFGTYQFIRSACIVAGLIIGLAGVATLIRALTFRTENFPALQVGDILKQTLDERYTYIRNFNRREIGYIDAMLVGPPGVLVCRILDREGVFYNEAAKWMEQDGPNWKTMSWSPTREVVDDIKALSKNLQENQFNDVPVYGIIIFVKPSPILEFSLSNPSVPVVYKESIIPALRTNYFAENRLTESLSARIVNHLLTN